MTATPTLDIRPGLRCEYVIVPRGGYGFAVAVVVTVLDVRAKMVRVEIEQSGKTKWVRPASLRPL